MNSEIPRHSFDFSKFAEALDVIEAINTGNPCVSIQKIEYSQRCRNRKCQDNKPKAEASKM